MGLFGESENLQLNEIDHGNLIEHAHDALAMAIADVANPNKKAKAPRVVTISIKISPDEKRMYADVDYEVKVKEAPHLRDTTEIFLGKADDGTAVAKPYMISQQPLPLKTDTTEEEDLPDNVRKFN